MSEHLSATGARLGSLGIVTLLPCPSLPNIIAEWAAILPLICHLASHRDDFVTTGEIALIGSLSVGLFPPLGSLSGLARLLRRGTKYLDFASTKGGSSRTVWDVQWGSVFPCANGAASIAISNQLMRRHGGPVKRIPESIPQPQPMSEVTPKIILGQKNGSSSVSTASNQGKPGELSAAARLQNPSMRRYQNLCVYQFYRRRQKQSLRHKVHEIRMSRLYRLVCTVLLTGVAVFLCAFGTYGTATIIVCAVVSEIAARSVTVGRPSGYLNSNETRDACMLVASHENATEWHLYIGDRGIVDTLLNKPMFIVSQKNSSHLISTWLRLADYLQLAAMTFVAAQKAWDGVCLVVLMALHRSLHLTFHGQSLAGYWLNSEGVDAAVRSFEFSGRQAMIGAVQIFSKTTTSRWMDSILVPHPRRDAWLALLDGHELQGSFNSRDLKWIEKAADAAVAAAEVLKKEFGQRRQDV
ncbi:hypothetical protein QQS21_003367 [Conoideocrella luteorostrata]|uniref:Uncharacterized protein n=1 Tax=Conoideocrella luteorostrata TaxID=1105319 RepID=A0AAJ0CTG7_9HYPO|nr:hypothetical protein QQS21_003367 [Conoideocrella luteorostrata]